MDLDENTPPQENHNVKLGTHIGGSTASMGRKPQQSRSQDRLMITNLVLENFKSYAGKQEIGPLHQCFTAVVGPNGSGKSNVIDAILFVFGKQAKQLRLNRVSELIHKSDNFPNCEFAKVSVYFQRIINTSDDGSTFDVLPNSDFVVSRTAFINNDSKYHINGKVATRGEVVDLLKKHGVDMDNNRFLILQGEVEHIAMMKPKGVNPGEVGLLEYLEDIIGSNVFVEPIENAGKELEVLGVERTKRHNRLRIVEKEKDSLEATKVKAEDFIYKQKLAYDKKAIVYQYDRFKTRKEAELIEKQHHELLTKQAEQEHSMRSRKEKTSELAEQVAAQTKKTQQASKKVDKLKSKLKEFETEDVKLHESMTSLQSKQTKLQKSIKTEQSKVEEKKKLIESLQEETKKIEKEIEEGEEELSEQEKRLQTMREKMSKVLAPLHDQLSVQQRELMPFKETIVACQSKIDLSQSEQEDLSRRTKESHLELESILESIKTSKAKLEESQNKSKEVSGQLSAFEAQLKESESELKKLKEEDSVISQKVISARSQLDESSRSKSNSGLLANLKKFVSEQVSHGILGKLGELGSIEDKYDVAVTTACPALDNIVVTTTEVAQQCVEILRTKKLGRATFIILHEIRNLIEPSRAPFNPPQGSMRLFDLVKPDSEEVRVAFYHALSDTLVCENLDIASSVAFGTSGKGSKRYRVVTTSGALFDFAGTISGGGHKTLSGGLRVFKSGDSSSFSTSKTSELTASELSNLKQSIEDWNSRLKEIRSEIHRIELSTSQLKSNISKLHRQSELYKSESSSIQNQIEDLEQRLPDLKNELKNREAAENDFKAKNAAIVSKLEKEKQEAKSKSESIENAIAKLQQKIEEASGSELRKAESTFKQLTETIEEKRGSVTKSQVQITSSKKIITKSLDTISKNEEEVVAIDEEIKKVREELNELTEKALQATELLEEYSNAQAVETEALKKAQEEYESFKGDAHEQREIEFQLTEKLKNVDAKLKEQRNIMNILSTKIEEVARKKIELRIDENDDVDVEIVIKTDEELKNLDEREIKSLKTEIARLTVELEGQHLNIQAILDYREKLVVYNQHKVEVDEINAQFDAKHRELDSLRKQRLDAFMEGHSKINPKLKEMYTMITVTGSADLEISNSTDPFLDGITFSVRPPNKSWRPIQNLSGGEKTLSSLALVFALHYYKPTPLYVMDEIDAALDFKNVSIVANYIKERTKDAQFLIVSLRNFMFELADRLVGIYKTDNATKSVTINPSSFSLAKK